MRKGFLILFMFFCYAQLLAQKKDSIPSAFADSLKPVLLKQVTVDGKKPPMVLLADRTIINVDASVTNAGATIYEILERSPGVSIDRSGNISIKGKHGVTVMVDGKPVQVSGADLTNLLNGMNATQAEQIEIIDNPPSKYDASGNAGIINIITKKNKQKGVNANLSLSGSHGKFARTANSVSLSAYQGKFNVYANATLGYSKNFSDLYALRKYYGTDHSITALLEQPSYFTATGPSQSLKAGVDYYLREKTILGASLTLASYNRDMLGNNDAVWKNAAGVEDSMISTVSHNSSVLKNEGFNINARHMFGKMKELSADFDYVGYNIIDNQNFTHQLDAAGGYREALSGYIPSHLNIFTGKADYWQQFDHEMKIEFGWKSSHVKTNNRAEYYEDDGGGPMIDFGKTNHFLYNEVITAFYGSLQKHSGNITYQGGLRFEATHYDAEQLGNMMRKDSSFSRNYTNLFPTASITMQLDSFNSLSLGTGRRIDRPPFQSLNPFILVINKYTYQSGNPYYRPQYTWNTELSHNYKNRLITTLSYSITKDYFSQIFLTDNSGIIYYTEGNLDKMENIGLSVAAQLAPASWWSLSAQTTLNYKKIRGYIWNEKQTALTQMNVNMNNQFKFGHGWSGEVSAFFNTREVELQEITDPMGQVSAGVAKQLFNNRASIKFSVRDIFYTQIMKGNTTFNGATEYFRLSRDTRFATLAFTFRFGGSEKNGSRKPGGAEEEIKRVDTSH